MSDFGKIEQSIRMSLENCACLGRDAYGNYIDKLVNSIMKQIREVDMNEISEGQRLTINRYKFLIRKGLEKDYDDWFDFANIVIAMNELSADIMQYMVLEANNSDAKLVDPIRIKKGETDPYEES